MTEDRPYRRGLSPQAAIDELQREAGGQFFADVVKTFVRVFNDGALWDGFTSEERELYVRNDLVAS
jgi:HD-GYP domain-containing protein (c-di-GMP phosphodiesterase class II)